MLLQILLNTLLVPLGAILWFWGGCGADCQPGLPPFHKSWRRHVWPVVVGLALLLNGFHWFPTTITTALLVGVNSLGYGEDKSWVWRVIVALALGVPFMVIYHLWIWPVVTLVTFIPLYMLSLKRNWMTWGVVEATVGASQGAIVLATILLHAVFQIMFGA